MDKDSFPLTKIASAREIVTLRHIQMQTENEQE
jgi:hypothetical protein